MRRLRQTSPEAAALARRLARLGLKSGVAVEVHENRSVMVSLTRRGALRVHRGYAFAPDETLRLCVLCLVAEGHLIIEDFPGVGKTMLAKALARSLGYS